MEHVEENPQQETAQSRPAHPSHRMLWLVAVMALAILLIALAAGYLPRHRRVQAAEEAAQRERKTLPVVNVAEVKRAEALTHILLPGNITPMAEASLYARASGYLKKRFVDIGDHVRRGQIMAEIEAPDLDQQVAQARAAASQAQQQVGQNESALEQARANLELARVTWERYKVLVEKGAISRQDADTQYAAFKTGQAIVAADEANVRAASDNVRAARANLDRIIALQEFEQIRAPFDGVVTGRSVDVGAFISSQGTSTGGGLGASAAANASPGASSNSGAVAAPGELFRVAQVGTLRILIDLPQTNSPDIHVGQPADVMVQEYPNRRFGGRLTRMARAFDPASRTMTTEIQVPNSDGALMPGMYAEVEIVNRRSNPPLLIPGDSVISGANGLQVAMVQGSKPARQGDVKTSGQGKWRVHLQSVQVGRDYGAQTEVTSGLKGGEFVVVNPSDVVREGAEVTAQAANQGPAAQQKSASAK